MSVYIVSRPKIERGAKIKRLRAFPSIGTLMVAPGDSVKRDTVLGEYASRHRLRSVRVEVSSGSIAATLLVDVGQKVKRGEVLGYYSFMFGLGYTEYTAPCDGEVISIVQNSGTITIKENPSAFASHLEGRVDSVDASFGVWVETDGDLVEGVAGAGYGRSGELACLVDQGSASAEAQSIDASSAGKIIFLGAHATKEAVEACLRYRASGMIAGSISHHVFGWYRELAGSLDWDEFLSRYWARELRNKDAEVPLPTEIVPALVVTEGFGHIPMPAATFELLSAKRGQIVFVDGGASLDRDLARSLGAGPAVIGAASSSRDSREMPEGPVKVGSTVKVGSNVKVIGMTDVPYSGTIGEILEHNTPLPNDLSVPAVKVVDSGGREQIVPVSNLEIDG